MSQARDLRNTTSPISGEAAADRTRQIEWERTLRRESGKLAMDRPSSRPTHWISPSPPEPRTPIPIRSTAHDTNNSSASATGSNSSGAAGKGLKERQRKPADGVRGSAPVPVCEACGGSRWLIDREHGGGLKPCPVCKEVERDRIALLSRMNWLNLRMQRWTFENYDQDVDGVLAGLEMVRGFCDDIIATWRHCLERSQPFSMNDCGQGRWCVTLWGGYGSGKTHLLAAVVNACTKATVPAVYALSEPLWEHLGCVRNPDENLNFEARLVALCQVPVLCLDEPGGLVNAAGDAQLTAAARKKRTRIIEYRYANLLPTIIADQRNPDQWGDDRIADRILEGINDAVFHDLPESYRRRVPAELAHDTPERVWDRGEDERWS